MHGGAKVLFPATPNLPPHGNPAFSPTLPNVFLLLLLFEFTRLEKVNVSKEDRTLGQHALPATISLFEEQNLTPMLYLDFIVPD